jgi:TetR/AcrR family transcriptional regulator, repressor of fatR-cypB operon
MNRLGSQEGLSRKEREKLARQQDILKAARELFVTKGYRETTLDEIAQLAEFGKGTLYNYFANKEEIFCAIVDQTVDDTLALARESVDWPGGIREKLTHYVSGMINYTRQNGELLYVIAQELHNLETPRNAKWVPKLIARAQGAWEILGEVLRQGMDEGTLSIHESTELIVLLDGMVRGYCLKNFLVTPQPSDQASSHPAELIVSVFLDGITERKIKG